MNTFEQIEHKFYEFLTGGGMNAEDSFYANDPDVKAKIREINDSAKEYWDSMEKGAEKSFIWSGLPMDFSGENLPASTIFEMTNTFLRLSIMCQAYRTKGGGLYGNKDFSRDIIDALSWMNINKYKPDGKSIGNWWDWQVGCPLRFIDCIVLMKDEMPQELYRNCVDALLAYVNQGTPGAGDANSMWNLFIRLMIGVLNNDDAYIRRVIDGVNNEWFQYSVNFNGFYTDGSYVMHSAFPYTGSYGASAIESVAKLAYLVNGTEYDLNGKSKNLAIRWIKEAYAPVIYKGIMMDTVRGRSMTRVTEGDHSIGHVIIRSIYLLALIVPEEESRPVKELIKFWIQNDTHRSIYFGKDVTNNNNYLFFINKLKQFMNDPSVQAADEPVFHKLFAAMARVVHARPGYTFVVSMHNSLICNYESIHGENRRGWHTASGMTYLYNSDLGQFSDDFWPTVNSHRLPGITANRDSVIPAHRPNGDSWAGGAVIDGLYGIAGMYLKPFSQTLAAKKSWFMFDEEIIALGSGICSSNDVNVETVIENRKLKPDNGNIFTVDGKTVPEQTAINNPSQYRCYWLQQAVQWIHLSGNCENSDIGYYFPDPSEIHFIHEKREDNWHSVNSNTLMSGDNMLAANYLTLYFDHGYNPEAASYSYVLLPGKTAQQVKKYSENPGFAIIENSENSHGVYHKNLQITGVNFWNDIEKKTGFITCDRKSSVMVKETDTEITVSVSDPTGRDGVITVRLDLSAAGCISHDDNITIGLLSPSILFSVNVNGKLRSPSNIIFRKGSVDYVPAEKINLDKNEITMSMLDTDLTLSPHVEPSEASQFVTLSSSDVNIADVYGNLIIPKKAGMAFVKVKSADGRQEASCKIIVNSSNLALGKPATEINESNKNRHDTGFPARLAVNGIENVSNRWAADRDAAENWIQIDLEKNHDIEGVKILWADSYASKYLLQLTDNPAEGNWTTVYTETEGKGGCQRIKFDKTYKAQYFRLYVASKNDRSSPQFGVSIHEIEIYGN